MGGAEYGSWDVTVRNFQDGIGATSANYPAVVAAAEKEKRIRYSFIPNGAHGRGLFVPLVFSPLGYVSDETARLAWIIASLQSRKLIDDREWDDDGHWFKFYRSVFYRRVLAHIQVAAITAGMRRYFRDRPPAYGHFCSTPLHLDPDVGLSLHSGPSF